MTAGSLLRKLDVREAPVPVMRIADELGVHLHRTRGKGWLGALRASGFEAHVWLDDSLPMNEQRWVLGHHLGSLMLHPLEHEYRLERMMGAGDAMHRASQNFAAELLMPAWMLHAYLHTMTDVSRLAALFEVTEHVMALRLASHLRL